MIRIMSDEGDKVEALIEQLLSESATNKRRGKQKEDAKKLEKEVSQKKITGVLNTRLRESVKS